MPDTRSSVFLFLLESFEWLHRWHGHDEARRVADPSVGILLREGEGDRTRRGRFGMQIEEKIINNSYQYLERTTCSALEYGG
jgi:hypothetical protein